MDFDFDVYLDNVICCGAHFQGKSFFIAKAVVKPLTKVSNVWVWDYHGVLAQYCDINPKLVKHDIKDLEYGVNFIIPRDKSYRAYQKFLEKALTHRHLTVVSDEAHNYSSSHKLEGAHAEIIRNAGNQQIGYIEIFQRPQRVNGDVLENSKHRFVFALDNLNSIRYMREWIGLEIELFLSPNNRSNQARKYLDSNKVIITHSSPQAEQFFNQTGMLAEHSFVYRDKSKLFPEVVNGGLVNVN